MATTLTYTSRGSGGDGTGSVSMSVAAEGYNQRQVLLPPGTTNKEIDLDFVYTALKACFITCDDLDDNVTITLRTNSTGAPGDTKTFITPGAIVYMVDANGASLNGASAPFTADVTRIYASNPSTTQTGNLRVEVLFDATP
jgi:nitrogen regulatory protein PII